jgi:hypothetical protein
VTNAPSHPEPPPAPVAGGLREPADRSQMTETENAVPAGHQAPEGTTRLFRPGAEGVLRIALVAGIAYRLLQYLIARSLWLDELLMLPGFTAAPWRSLLLPTSVGPTAPGFLLLEKVAWTALGGSELSLRLVPLLAGIASLLVFARVCRAYLPPRAAAAAVAAFALSPYLVYYSSELKPYASDVLVALLLTWQALRLNEGEMTARRAARLVLTGLAATYFSLPAVFVLGGTMLALAASYYRRGDRRSVQWMAAAIVALAAVFAAPLLLLVAARERLAASAQPDYARAFWNRGFMPLPPASVADLEWLPHVLVNYFRDPLGIMTAETSSTGFYQAAGGMLCAVAGGLWLRRRNGFLVAAVLLPVAVALAASALHVYPFGGNWVTGGRVVLYLAPGVLLLVGAGFEALYSGVSDALRPLAWGAILLAVVPSAGQVLLTFPSGRAEIKPMLAYVREHREPSDLLYVHYDASLAFDHYAPRYGIPAESVVRGPCARLRPVGYVQAAQQLRGRRVWFLFTNGIGAHGFNERELMLKALDHLGRRVDDRVSNGASVYLYDLAAAPKVAAPFQSPIPEFPESLEHGCALWGG